MWEKLDETIPVSASVLIVVLSAIVVVQSIYLFNSKINDEAPVTIIYQQAPQKSMTDVTGDMQSGEGVFQTMDEEEENSSE